MEQWKTVPGTNGKIEVSNEGRVRSLLRGAPYILKTSADKKGYQRLRVTINREKMAFKLHRIVAEAFIDNPENKPQVNHIDGNKNNNAVSNLEWVTNKENVKHAIENGLWESVFIGANKHYKALRKQIIASKDGDVLTFDSVGEAERYFNSRHISDAAKGKRPHVKGWKISYREVV